MSANHNIKTTKIEEELAEEEKPEIYPDELVEPNTPADPVTSAAARSSYNPETSTLPVVSGPSKDGTFPARPEKPTSFVPDSAPDHCNKHKIKKHPDHQSKHLDGKKK